MERRDINIATFEKVKGFLEKQKEPVYKTELVKLGVNNNSLNFILKMLKIKVEKDGRVSLKC